MSDRLKELREKRGVIVTNMRAITDTAQTEKRDLTDEEVSKHGELFEESRKIGKQIEVEERQLEANRLIADRKGEEEERKRAPNADPAKPTASEEYRAAFSKLLKNGREGLTSDEVRALSAGVGSQGGFLIAPEQFSDRFIKFVDDEVLIRQWATIIPVSGAASLGVPTLDTDPDDADWTSELATGSEDSSMAFGKRKMQANPLAKRIKVSNDLLRMTPAVESMVAQRLAYKFGIAQEKAFLTGNGSSRPLGLFTAHDDGVPTSRDVSTGNTTTGITFDGLITAKYSLKSQYRKGGKAKWLFHKDAIAQIAKLKDSQNQYLWQPSKKDGEPDTVLGIPVAESEYVPNTFTTGLYVGMLADFSFYWIADSMSMELKRLDELYAETNQTGFIGRMHTDGQPVLSEAFVRVTLA